MTKPIGTAAWMYPDVSCFEVAAKLESYPREAFSYVRKPKSQWRAAKHNPRSQASHGINMMWPHAATVSRRTGICQSRKSPCKWCSSSVDSVGQTALKLISTDKPKRMIYILYQLYQIIYTWFIQHCCNASQSTLKRWPWWICLPLRNKKMVLPFRSRWSAPFSAAPLQVGGEVEAMFDRHRQLPRLHFVRFQTWAIEVQEKVQNQKNIYKNKIKQLMCCPSQN